MTQQEELKIRLEQHQMWLNDRTTGAQFVAKFNEDLSYANLSYANLTYANLSYANLSYANLSDANLRSANLSYANLTYANLSDANLSYANLSYANLSDANLSDANLSYANLSYANLSDANLSYANLSYANLTYANLSDANGKNYKALNVFNTKFSITILGDCVLWGCKKLTFAELKEFKFSDCQSEWDENEFKLNKKIITELIRYYRA